MTGIFMNLLNWIYSWLGNYGWSVVLFTLLIRLVMLPLDIKSKKSMRAMSKIQPQLQALQAKYANDKEKLNQKTMELYKKERVSPTAGCLPMLISLPILFIMFSAMRTVGDEHTVQMILDMKNGVVPKLEGWLWIKNVFQPDSITTMLPIVASSPATALRTIRASAHSAILTEEHLAAAREFLASAEYSAMAAPFMPASAFTRTTINLLFAQPSLLMPTSFANLVKYSNGYFILPILAAGSQFLMTKIMNGQQTPEQKAAQDAKAQDSTNPMNSPMMKWFFPIFSLWICATSNAAFSIYWMAANVIQIAQQLAVNAWFEHQDKKAAAAAASETTDH